MGEEPQRPHAYDRTIRRALILQARMGSVRLPGKSMMDLAGAPLLARILERVKRCKSVDDIVLAIPASESNDVLANLGKEMGVTVFRGSEDDLVGRYCAAARAVDADVIARLPADNVCPEPTEIDRIIEFHCLENQGGFSSNLSMVFGNGYPDGIGAEVFDLRSLEEIDARLADPRKREHPHLNFFDYSIQKAADPERYPVHTVTCPPEFARPDIVLDVNTDEQYRLMRSLYEYLYPRKPDFHITDVIEWFDRVAA